MGGDRQGNDAPGRAMNRKPRRGEVYYVNFDPVVGSEQGGHRPALIIQNDAFNEFSPVVIVAAISSRMLTRDYSTDVVIEPRGSGLSVRSRIMLNQIRTIDKSRLGQFVGELSNEELELVDRAIQITLDAEGT